MHMDLEKLLHSRLVGPVSASLGNRLTSAVYRCLESEITDEAQLEDPHLYIGGELHLFFGVDLLVVTWDENAGWPDHFSLYAGTAPLFLKDTGMTEWPASHLSPWHTCVGEALERVTVFADDATPHVLAFRFGANIVVVGDGSQERFGDGDDLLIRDERGLADVESWLVMWDSE